MVDDPLFDGIHNCNDPLTLRCSLPNTSIPPLNAALRAPFVPSFANDCKCDVPHIGSVIAINTAHDVMKRSFNSSLTLNELFGRTIRNRRKNDEVLTKPEALRPMCRTKDRRLQWTRSI